MNEKHSTTAFVSFTFGYLIAYYLLLWVGNTILSDETSRSMIVMGEYANKLRMVLLGSPLVTTLFGPWVASVSASSYTAMGSHRLNPARFFAIGWACFCIANWIIVSAGLQLFIDEAIGREWLQQIGQANFNAWFFLLAPTLGYFNGIFITVLVRRLIEAQNS